MKEKAALLPPMSQSKKFIDAARELATDDAAKRFYDLLGKVVKHKPVEKLPAAES
jgi:hypothetical protein